MKSTVGIRERVRELAARPAMDDYDRAVLMVLDDLEALIAGLEAAKLRALKSAVPHELQDG